MRVKLLLFCCFFGFGLALYGCIFNILPDSPVDVTNLTAIRGDGQMTLSWTDPSYSGFDHVEVTWTPSGITIRTVPKGVQTLLVTGLSNFTDYTFTVKTVNTASNKSTGATVDGMPINGLVGEWLFSGNANDSSGNGLDGTVFGATAANDRFGNANCAYSFDGASNHIEVADNTLLQLGTGDYSFIIWVNFATQPISYTSALNKQDPSNPWPGPVFFVGLDHNVNIVAGDVFTQVDCNNWRGTEGKAFNDSAWHMFAVVRSGTELRLYMDASAPPLITSALPPVDISAAGTNLWFGANPSGGGFYQGLLDDIRIFNIALSDADVAALFGYGGWTGL